MSESFQVLAPPRFHWLTRNVFAIGMLSLFSDTGHELTTAILPLFLQTFGGGGIALGTIEGVSDVSSSLLKMWMSHYSSRIGKRRPIVIIAYLVTALMGCFAFVTRCWELVAIPAIAWIGREARGHERDALPAESVPGEAHGRAVGFESAMDRIGAILEPAVALPLIGIISLGHIVLIRVIPESITVLIAIFLIKDVARAPQPNREIWGSLRALPRQFLRYVSAVGDCGQGNFAHTLLVLRAVVLLTPKYGTVTADRMGVGLYILQNVIYAAISYPIEALGDRTNKKQILALGYALFGLMCLLSMHNTNLEILAIVFILVGVYIGTVDSMERAFAAALLPLSPAQNRVRGPRYGQFVWRPPLQHPGGFFWNRVLFGWPELCGDTHILGSILLFVWKPHRVAISSTS